MHNPPTTLLDTLTGRGLIPSNAEWTPLHGGRTNRTWRVEVNAIDFVCKLYPQNDNNPLFPNLAGSEFSALNALKDQNLAPSPIQLINSPVGVCLIYEYICGETWTPTSDCLKLLAQAMKQLHTSTPPENFTFGPPIASKVLLQGQKILRLLSSHSIRKLPEAPNLPYITEVPPVFLHGDLVPSNILVTGNGVRLIDWQCPSLGDPVEDFAVLFSPAMQLLYGGQQLTSEAKNKLLHLYSNENLAKRYRLLAPLFHWRMAAYCLWKAEQGSPDYEVAFEAELKALKEISL